MVVAFTVASTQSAVGRPIDVVVDDAVDEDVGLTDDELEPHALKTPTTTTTVPGMRTRRMLTSITSTLE